MLDERSGSTGARSALSALENLKLWAGSGGGWVTRDAVLVLPDPLRPVSSHWLPLEQPFLFRAAQFDVISAGFKVRAGEGPGPGG